MWRIFQFLGRFGNLLLFLFLEFVALMIVATVNKPQREISRGLMLEFSAGVSEVQSNVGDYFELGSQNRELAEQNAELMARLASTRDTLRTLRHRRPMELDFIVFSDSMTLDSDFVAGFLLDVYMPDSLFPINGYKFIPAHLINNSLEKNYNYLTLDKGSRHGIRPGMGLISPKGVAGLVTNVSRNYSLALSVLNKKFNLSARLKGNSNIGNLTWEGGAPEFATLQYIPRTTEIEIGDTVVTSGFSTTFPPDYLVGTIEQFNSKTEDGFFNITVRLATDFRSLDNLYVVDHDRYAELDSLWQKGEEE